MAEGKKSFIAYSDWKAVFDELPDEDAGKLIKHIFAYVNDENPESDSVLIRAVFANIKTTLKRDLDKWESQMQQRREAGKRSAEQRKATTVQRKATTVDSRTRNSTVNVNVNVNEKYKTMFENFRKLYPGIKRGLDTEFENMQKKHKDYKDVIPQLEEIIKNQIKHRENKKGNGEFVPQWKNLSTWINNRSWEEVFTPIETKETKRELKPDVVTLIRPDGTRYQKDMSHDKHRY